MKTELYLVKLNFHSSVVGGGSMTLQLAVNPASDSLFGRAEGTIHEGTYHAPHFTADCTGSLHSTGIKPYTKVGGVAGQAMVCFPPPAMGCYLTAFKATFAVDSDWNGDGTLTVGNDSYKCKVSLAD